VGEASTASARWEARSVRWSYLKSFAGVKGISKTCWIPFAIWMYCMDVVPMKTMSSSEMP
jgi:hypothetical protein